jgi:ATP dependent DNA ligase domain
VFFFSARQARPIPARPGINKAAFPQWVQPPLTELVDAVPEGNEWSHEIKFDGYRMHPRLDRGDVRMLTRTGLDWTHKYPAIAKAVAPLDACQAYLDGELCGVFPNSITSFSIETACGHCCVLPRVLGDRIASEARADQAIVASRPFRPGLGLNGFGWIAITRSPTLHSW